MHVAGVGMGTCIECSHCANTLHCILQDASLHNAVLPLFALFVGLFRLSHSIIAEAAYNTSIQCASQCGPLPIASVCSAGLVSALHWGVSVHSIPAAWSSFCQLAVVRGDRWLAKVSQIVVCQLVGAFVWLP